MTEAREPAEHLPLTPPAFYVLLTLAEGERHGYALMKDIETATGGAVRLGPGTLYGILKRLIGSGLIAEVRDKPAPGEERRRRYRLTEHGRQVARAEAERLQQMVDLARATRLLGGLEPA